MNYKFLLWHICIQSTILYKNILPTSRLLKQHLDGHYHEDLKILWIKNVRLFILTTEIVPALVLIAFFNLLCLGGGMGEESSIKRLFGGIDLVISRLLEISLIHFRGIGGSNSRSSSSSGFSEATLWDWTSFKQFTFKLKRNWVEHIFINLIRCVRFYTTAILTNL